MSENPSSSRISTSARALSTSASGGGPPGRGEGARVERAGVGADADRYPAVGRLADDGADLAAVTDVARVEPQSLHARLERHEGEAVGEVDVGDDGDTRLGAER